MSQSSNHLRLVSWTWQWVHFTQMASTVTRSQYNRAPLGCGGTGDSHHGCTAQNLQQLCDAIVLIWTKISEECFQHLVESMPRRIKAVLKVQPSISKVCLVKWPVSVCVMALVTVAGLCESSVLLFKGKVAWYMFNIYGIFKDTFFFC